MGLEGIQNQLGIGQRACFVDHRVTDIGGRQQAGFAAHTDTLLLHP